MATVAAAASIRTIETHWIPLADGRRLAARLFLPQDADENPVPLILEYIPYRRRDLTRIWDDMMHRWFAANGFATARVDIAGSGDSDGVLEGEYLPREQDDALEVIEHLCTQAWCTGVAAMIGISWGGFSGLQTAARRPPRLKAIVTVCSTADRYACDAHYSGGLLLNDNFVWGAALSTFAALPPDPAVVGEERWRDMWRERLAGHSLFPATWLEHQRRDELWKHGSVCEDWSAIQCPVLAVGGWQDGFASQIVDLVENLPGICKAVLGPWGHMYPMIAAPGPTIGFLQECARWFDHWLKGVDNGVAEDPAMRLYLMEPSEPASYTAHRAGRWLGFETWPSTGIDMRRLAFGEDGLAAWGPPPTHGHHTISSPLTTGLRGQEWCPGMGQPTPDGASDQREDDAGSLCFDTAALEEDVSLVGGARLTLRLSADQPQAMVAARINSVAPDGASALVTFAMLNLSHRSGHEQPEKRTPGHFETVELLMKPVGQVIPRGHRLRVAISTSYWPMAWPSPTPTTLTIDTAGCVLELPVLEDDHDVAPVSFEEAVHAEPGAITVIHSESQSRSAVIDMASDRTVLTSDADEGRLRIEETGVEMTTSRKKICAISRSDPTTCTTTVECHHELRRDDWDVSIDTEIAVSCDSESFHIAGTIRTFDNGRPFAERTYDHVIPRDSM